MAARRTKPGGSKPDKVWTDALRLAVMREVKKGEPTKRLEVLAAKLVELAASGNMAAIKEIGDRLDGKPAQVIAGDDKSPMKLVVEIIDPTRRC